MPDGKDSLDAYKAGDTAARVEAARAATARLAPPQPMMLAALAGVFIAFVGAFHLADIAGDAPPSGALRLAGGVALSPGLILAVAGGAELFTGGALMVMARMDGPTGLPALPRNWALAVIAPIAAFVTLGLEHSVANMFLPRFGSTAGAAAGRGAVCGNLAPVTLGNIVGGAGGVARACRIAHGPRETR